MEKVSSPLKFSNKAVYAFDGFAAEGEIEVIKPIEIEGLLDQVKIPTVEELIDANSVFKLQFKGVYVVPTLQKHAFWIHETFINY